MLEPEKPLEYPAALQLGFDVYIARIVWLITRDLSTLSTANWTGDGPLAKLE